MTAQKPKIERLRREAKRMKKAGNGEFTYTECLDIIARQYGYSDWKDCFEKHKELDNG